MSSRRSVVLCVGALAALAVTPPGPSGAQQPAVRRAPAGLAALKREAAADVAAHAQLTQQIVDQLYSYGELGYQEIETSRYLVQLLRDNGFVVEQGIAGLPTAWIATWGSGKPVLSLGADLDDIPQASQVPGVACHLPLVDGAPGHGEGHNAGPAVNIVAALAVKRLMERDHLPGTLKIWPGVAEELGGGKAFLVRAGYFKDTDIVLFAHVASVLETGWGDTPGTGNISVLYSFKGQSAHAAAAPWRGRSALDAVELMDVGWNFRREHLRPAQRSHYVIKDGGDQPNVVPSTASVWYYLRELDGPHIAELFAIADSVARGAALMTGTSLASERILGSAWPGHFNKVVAQTMYENIKQVGLPKWSDADQTLAKAVQHELHVAEQGLDSSLAPLPAPPTEEQRHAGFSDDIGDVSWNVPTVVLLYPSNIPNLPGHNWSNGITMATPIAHKGASAGAKVQAMTLLDFLLRPELVQQAWDYFRTVQTKTIHYAPLIRPEDQPALELNVATMEKYRPAMRKLYYEPTKYATYLEQLGVAYPTLRQADGRCVGGPAR
jgi:aminobenzoyl-glutamate utilization protein B